MNPSPHSIHHEPGQWQRFSALQVCWNVASKTWRNASNSLARRITGAQVPPEACSASCGLRDAKADIAAAARCAESCKVLSRRARPESQGVDRALGRTGRRLHNPCSEGGRRVWKDLCTSAPILCIWSASLRSDLCREAYCTTGYTPFLSFQVVDLQQTVSNMLQLGGTLDGAIKYPASGKVAAIRAPDGQMLSLHEPNTP